MESLSPRDSPAHEETNGFALSPFSFGAWVSRFILSCTVSSISTRHSSITLPQIPSFFVWKSVTKLLKE